MKPLRLLLATSAILACNQAVALNYSCDELADMAVRFYELKQEGYQLEDVVGSVQDGSKNSPEKEELLGNLAIDIFLDSSISSVADSRQLAYEQCKK